MITIEQADLKDIKTIVDIHIDAFKDFFLSSLGKDFLELYYSCFIKNSKAVVLVAKSDNEIIGFAAATSVSKGFNTSLVKENLFSFALISVKLLFTKPHALLRLARNLSKTSDNGKFNDNYAELFSIGVLPAGQGKGIGKMMLGSVEDNLRNTGVERLSLTTDYYNNTAVPFYQSMGYTVLYDFIAYPERRMYRFIKDLK